MNHAYGLYSHRQLGRQQLKLSADLKDRLSRSFAGPPTLFCSEERAETGVEAQNIQMLIREGLDEGRGFHQLFR